MSDPPTRSTGGRLLVCGDVEVDRRGRFVRVAGRRVLPTFAEFELLLLLIAKPDQALTRQELRACAGLHPAAAPRAIDVLIARLRRKLRGAHSFVIETVPHVGYRCTWVSGF